MEALGRLWEQCPYQLLLTGAANEYEINEEFRQRYQARWGSLAMVENLAGTASLSMLSGIIGSCDLFVSSDSGPYHMSVALGKPTIALFRWPNPEHYHRNGQLQILVEPAADLLLKTLLQSLEIC